MVLGRVCCALVVRAVVAASIFRHLSSYAFSGLVVKLENQMTRKEPVQEGSAGRKGEGRIGANPLGRSL